MTSQKRQRSQEPTRLAGFDRIAWGTGGPDDRTARAWLRLAPGAVVDGEPRVRVDDEEVRAARIRCPRCRVIIGVVRITNSHMKHPGTKPVMIAQLQRVIDRSTRPPTMVRDVVSLLDEPPETELSVECTVQGHGPFTFTGQQLHQIATNAGMGAEFDADRINPLY